MASDSLILGLAGNVPYYSKEDYLTPSHYTKLKRWFMDYRCLDYNQPVGKGATYLLEALSDYNGHSASFQLRMWGNISPMYRDLVNEMGLNDRVEISDFVPKQESLKKLETCDILVLTLALGVGSHPPFSLPGKMFDYFLVGKPILALVQPSYCYDILQDSGLAIVADPLDRPSIQRALTHFIEHRESLDSIYKLKKGFLERFGREAMVDTMAQLFDEVLS